MTKSFSEKIVLVTGAGSGLGKSIAIEFARSGAELILCGRNSLKLAKTKQEIESLVGIDNNIHIMELDVTQSDSVEIAFSEIEKNFERIDLAINNAGIFAFNYVVDTPLLELKQIIDTNFIGVFDCISHQIRIMRKYSSGVIVNISSNMSSGLNIAGTAAYTASKAALDALTRVAAKEAIANGIRIFSINPGPLKTDMTKLLGESSEERDERWKSLIPIGRMGDPVEISEAIIWACSERSAYFIGDRLVIDGGHSL